jgi:hypothetical protein
MTAVQSSAEDRGGELARAPGRRVRVGRPSLLVVSVPVVVAVHLGLTVAGLVETPFRGGDLMTFAALLACGAVCIEATRRLGMPAGVARDLLSAWWLPVALLLPPVYALLIPVPVQALLQFRVRRTLIYRRAVVAAALGIAGACASAVFHVVVPEPLEGAPQWVVESYPGIPAAVGCAALFTVVNAAIVAVAAHAANPESRWRDVLWTRESLLLDLVELCVGILVAITSALSLGMLVLALPPVMLLQRSLMHQQLQAAARTWFRPASFAAYTAASAACSRSDRVLAWSGRTASPTDVVRPLITAGSPRLSVLMTLSSATLVRIRSAAAPAAGRSASGSRMTNSSPPNRPTTS